MAKINKQYTKFFGNYFDQKDFIDIKFTVITKGYRALNEVFEIKEYKFHSL